MNILFLQGTYPSFGGVERVTTLLSNEFCKRGYGVHSVSFVQPNPEIAERDLDKRVILHKLSYPVSDKNNIKKLHHIVVDNDINIIISQWAALYKVARMIKKAIKGTSCKLITVHHTLPSNNNQIQKAKNALETSSGIRKLINRARYELIRFVSRVSVRGTYHYSDLYVLLSPQYIPIAQKFIWVKNRHKITAIPNPLGDMPEPIDFETKENEILYVGRIDYTEKMTFRLLDVWRLLQDKYPDWRLTFVGDGPDRMDMENRAKDMGSANVFFEGFQKPDKYYRRAKIVVLCSAYEGFGMVLIEGMAHKAIPVALGNFEAIYDIIDNGKNGIIVPPPYNSNIFADTLENIINKRGNLASIANSAYEKSKCFATKNIVDSWEELFKSLFN